MFLLTVHACTDSSPALLDDFFMCMQSIFSSKCFFSISPISCIYYMLNNDYSRQVHKIYGFEGRGTRQNICFQIEKELRNPDSKDDSLLK